MGLCMAVSRKKFKIKPFWLFSLSGDHTLFPNGFWNHCIWPPTQKSPGHGSDHAELFTETMLSHTKIFLVSLVRNTMYIIFVCGMEQPTQAWSASNAACRAARFSYQNEGHRLDRVIMVLLFRGFQWSWGDLRISITNSNHM